jgi:acyl carrier protein
VIETQSTENSDARASRDEYLVSPYVAPRTATEAKLAEIWQQVLNIDLIGATDLFEDLGGSSLLAAAIFVEIEKAFGVKIKMIMLVAAPTIEELSAKVEELAREPKG